MQKKLYLCRLNEIYAFLGIKMMKKKSFFTYIGCIVLLCCSLAGCMADIDLSDVDWSTSVSASLTLPVGSMSAQIGDFLDVSQYPQISVEDNRYVYRDTITSNNQYHPINLADLVTRSTSRWNIADEVGKIFNQLQSKHPEIIFALQFVYPELKDFSSIPLPITLPVEQYMQYGGSPLEFKLDFPIDIDLHQLNIDFNYQRVDSILVDIAHFTSIYTVENFDLQWDDIKSVEILLTDNFRNIDSVLTLPITGKGFGEALPIDLQDFHLILMKDPKGESSGDNIVEEINMKIRFTFEIDHDLTIAENQYIGYDFHVDLINYSAMFGYFAADTLLHDAMVNTPVYELWSGWEVFENWVLPVSEPTVKFEVDHTLGLPMAVELHHLYVESKNGERRNATFDVDHQQTHTTIHLPAKIQMTDPLEKRAYDTIQLDYTDTLGNIDTLFSVTPHAISYNFTVHTDTTSDLKQYRITNNTDINMNVMIEVPFTFNDSVHIAYYDTIDSINLAGWQLDSLLRDVQIIKEIETAELQLIATIENNIPFAIEGEFTLYNENNEVVLLNAMRDTTNIQNTSSIHLKINCPDAIDNGVVVTPSTTNLSLLTIRKEDFDLLTTVKYITFTAQLGDNQHTVNLNPQASVNIHLSIAADVEAIIDLEELF